MSLAPNMPVNVQFISSLPDDVGSVSVVPLHCVVFLSRKGPNNEAREYLSLQLQAIRLSLRKRRLFCGPEQHICLVYLLLQTWCILFLFFIVQKQPNLIKHRHNTSHYLKVGSRVEKSILVIEVLVFYSLSHPLLRFDYFLTKPQNLLCSSGANLDKFHLCGNLHHTISACSTLADVWQHLLLVHLLPLTRM